MTPRDTLLPRGSWRRVAWLLLLRELLESLTAAKETLEAELSSLVQVIRCHEAS